ncbi:MAG TPA: cytochrome b/b6 domain-containing protein [Paracoccaceae bacterium]|jgi:cytochrome b561|nr:cytochrome b/b6 domain-containing protein [Paracoccaceae bacterium]
MAKPPAYRPLARALHWATAVLVLATIPAGIVMLQQGLDRPLQNLLFMFHKNIGVVILLLVLIRLAYRAANPPPPLPRSVPDWQRRIAGLTHVLLYAALIVMAVSGYVRVVSGGFPLEWWDALGVPRLAPRSDAVAGVAKTIHWAAHYVVIALVVLHVGAALFHGVVKRDGVFARMWPALGR